MLLRVPAFGDAFATDRLLGFGDIAAWPAHLLPPEARPADPASASVRLFRARPRWLFSWSDSSLCSPRHHEDRPTRFALSGSWYSRSNLPPSSRARGGGPSVGGRAGEDIGFAFDQQQQR